MAKKSKWPNLESYIRGLMNEALDEFESPDDFCGEFNVEEKDIAAFETAWHDAYLKARDNL